jgi:uncharacterized membrane protein YGL010W
MTIAFSAGTALWVWIFKDYQPSEMKNVLILLNVVAWGFQFVGHGVFERMICVNSIERKPALLDNIFQILSAPLFVVIELFDLVGVRTHEI